MRILNSLKNLGLASVISVVVSAGAFAQVANVSVTAATVAGINTRTTSNGASSTVYLPNDGRTVLVVDNNQTSGVVTATIYTQPTQVNVEGYGPITLGNQTLTIPSSSISIIGPMPVNRWTASTGLTRVDLTSTTGISLTAVSMPK